MGTYLNLSSVNKMNRLTQCLVMLFDWLRLGLKYGLRILVGVFPAADYWVVSSGITETLSCEADSEEWKSNEVLRTYCLGYGEETKVTVQTSTHSFLVDLQRLSMCSEYFRALSQSRMRETSESLIHLDHVSSSIFHNLLEFSFHDHFKVPLEQLGAHIQVSSYLLAEDFLLKCLSVLEEKLTPSNCLSYLSFAQEICCTEMKATVLTYLSRNLLELPHVIRCLNEKDKEDVVHLRMRGERVICSLRKENLTSWNDPETESARHVYALKGSEIDGDWHSITEFPFRADKWCFTTVMLYNYLYIIGGYRQRRKRSWEFNMASFRYNPLTHMWAATSSLIKHRRHFSAVACEGCIYAVGGWYLDSLVTPDCSTALYTAVERYDPWEDSWSFVSSLPLTDFKFTMSMSHDVPLAASLGHYVYVLGNIERTGEKLLLQYDTKQDSWSELLPTLTRADVDLPTLYFLGGTDRLLVIGGNNSENVVTSYCVQSEKWGEMHKVEKVALAGQGTIVDNHVLMPSTERNTVLKMDVGNLSQRNLPPLPVSSSYDSAFYLYF